jgi:putative SOS response-associated peptidase YedK
MCGRTRCTLSKEDCVGYGSRLSELVTVNESSFARFRASYNIGPGSSVPILVPDATHRNGVVLQSAIWGLIPHFSRSKPKACLFNARSEELSSKVSFKSLTSSKRCIVLSQGFYEWKESRVLGRKEKQPYYLFFRDDSKPVAPCAVMPMAGLFDIWVDKDTNERVCTCTILTTASSEEIRWLHDRMPVIPRRDEDAAKWLDVSGTKMLTRDMIQPYYNEECPIMYHKVTPRMSNVSYQGEECVQMLKEPLTLTNMFSAGSKKRKIKEEEAGKEEEEEEEHV